jgi:general nucleoside transport system permease protein
MGMRKPLLARNRRLAAIDIVIALVPVAAVLLALAVGALLLLALGANPIEAYGSMLDGAFGNQAAIFRTLTRATPLMLVAVGICIAFRGGVINIGAEGQLFVGAISATAFSLAFGQVLPSLLLIVGTLLVGFLAGAVWGFVPGILKARFEVNEILVTVMMNEIAIQLLFFLLSGPMIDPEQLAQGTRVPQSAQLPEAGWLPRLAPPSQLHAGLFIGIIAAALVYVLLWRTTLGYRIRAVGLNRDASQYAGISVPRYLTLALVLSGGLAGLAGAVEVTGVTHRVVEGFAVGYGFSGIVVALFGRLHPIGAIPSAFLFGALLVGAEKMQRTVQVPSATVIALEGLVVIFVVSSELFVRRWTARRNASADRGTLAVKEVTAPAQEVSL